MRDGVKLKLSASKKVVRTGCLDAWWYENKRSIDVYVEAYGTRQITHCRIPRAALVDYIRRSRP
jgi:hypothetical protein